MASPVTHRNLEPDRELIPRASDYSASLLVGFRMEKGKRRSWLHILSFTVITVLVAYVILDVENMANDSTPLSLQPVFQQRIN
jgi:hypothetical protein